MRYVRLRLGGRSGFGLRLGRRWLAVLPRLLLRALALLLPLAPTPPRAAGVGLRGGQVVGQRIRDLLDRSQAFARGVDQLVRAGRVALGGGQQRGADLARLLEGRVDELRRVLLVPVPAGVRQGPEQAPRLRELAARPAVLHLAGCTREPPGPAGKDLLRRIDLRVAERPQERAHAVAAVLVPGRRLRHESDEV